MVERDQGRQRGVPGRLVALLEGQIGADHAGQVGEAVPLRDGARQPEELADGEVRDELGARRVEGVVVGQGVEREPELGQAALCMHGETILPACCCSQWRRCSPRSQPACRERSASASPSPRRRCSPSSTRPSSRARCWSRACPLARRARPRAAPRRRPWRRGGVRRTGARDGRRRARGGGAVDVVPARRDRAPGAARRGRLAVGAAVRPTRRVLLVAGTISGVTGTVAAIGGPPIALVYQHATGPTIRATLALYFSVGTVLSLAALRLTGSFGHHEAVLSAVLLPGTMPGSSVRPGAELGRRGPPAAARAGGRGGVGDRAARDRADLTAARPVCEASAPCPPPGASGSPSPSRC